MTAYIILIVVVAVLLLGVGGATLLRPRGMHGVRRSRNRELDLTGSMPKVSDSGTGTGTDTITAPPTQRPPAEAPQAPPAAPPPTVEKPPPSAGRMVRLRTRLARSPSGFGSALLALLSRGPPRPCSG